MPTGHDAEKNNSLFNLQKTPYSFQTFLMQLSNPEEVIFL